MTADNNQLNEAQIDLPLTADRYQAEQAVQTLLKELRADAGCLLTATREALKLAHGDVVKVTHSTPGWTDKEFWVEAIAVTPESGEIQVLLREYDSTAYTLDALATKDAVPGTDHPIPFEPQVTFVSERARSAAEVSNKQAWEREVTLIANAACRSLNVSVAGWIQANSLDDQPPPSQTISSYSYNVDVAEGTTVLHTIRDSGGVNPAQLEISYDEGNLLPGQPLTAGLIVTLTPYNAIGGAGGSGKAGVPVKTPARALWGYDDVGFRTQEAINRRFDNGSDVGAPAANLSMNNTANGFAFDYTPATAQTFTQLGLNLRKVASPTGTLVFKIYADSAGLPGALLDTSDALDVSTLATSYPSTTPATIKLTFPTLVALSAATLYHFAAEYSDGDATNYVDVGALSSGASDELNGSWAAGPSNTPMWRLYVADFKELMARSMKPGFGVTARQLPSGKIEVAATDVNSFGAIGDGVAKDHVAINEALNSNNRVVHFQAGATYLIGSDIHFRSGQHLIGNGAIIRTDAAVKYMFRNHDIDQANYGGGSDIIIEGFIFDGENVARDIGLIGLAHTTNVTIRNCVFKDLNSSGLHAIDAAGNEHLTIENCLFEDVVGATALQIDAATSGSMPTLTLPNLEIASATRSHDVMIRGNWFLRCGSASSSFQAVHLHKKGHNRIHIIDNHFFDCWGGIRDDLRSPYRPNGATTDIVIRGNEIDMTSSSSLAGGGILLDYAQRVVIESNVIRGTGTGIALLNYAAPTNITAITKANPAVVTATAHGLSNGHIIYISGVGGMTEVNGKFYKIANKTTNTIEPTEIFDGANVNSTGFGTYTSGGTIQYKTFSSTQRNDDIIILGNTIEASTSNAIIIENGEQLVVADNVVTDFGENDNHKAGVRIDKAVRVKVSGNQIRSSTSGTKFPIALYRSYRYAITDNDCQNGLVAIFVRKMDRTQTDFGRIEGNHLDLGTAFMLHMEGNTTNLIKNVSIVGNTFFGQFSGHCIRVDRGEQISVVGNTLEDVKATSSRISLNRVSGGCPATPCAPSASVPAMAYMCSAHRPEK